MIGRYELVVKAVYQITNDQLESGEAFNGCFSRCCTWMQYGYPITVEGINKLQKTNEWDGSDTPGYWTAVQNLGDPGGMLVEQSFLPPIKNRFGIYTLFLAGKQGIALAIGRTKVNPTFPPRKNLEFCECYIFNPIKGIFHTCVRGINKFNEITKQEIINQSAEILSPKNKTKCNNLCFADITKHAIFIIKENTNDKNRGVKFS
jgi:hypothetical protein